MSHDPDRKGFRDFRDRDRKDDWDRRDRERMSRNRDPRRERDYRNDLRTRERSRSLVRQGGSRRSPRKSDKDMLDENILSEISKLPEPSELWDNQFQDGGFGVQPPPPGFQTEPTNPSYAPVYQPSYSGLYDEFPSVGVGPLAQIPSEMASWNQMSLPPPPVQGYHIEDQIKKEAAIETEMRHQKAALSKQREDYIKKAGILKKELDTLKDQRNELRGDAKRSPSPDTKRFLKENTKLQLEIQNKLKTITNVVDMLNGIIGEEAQEIPETDDSPDRKRKSRSPSGNKFNYVYYDPEMHWCRVCNEFPPTAKDYLNHLHSAAHNKMAAAHMEAPWHSMTGVNEGFPSVPSAPTKRTPIRGLQFFVPSTAWYCKLCDQFIGDLHCASAHLKSIVHSKNYTNFVEQNPHWETDWMSDRQKAFEKARAENKNKPPIDKLHYTAHTITFSKDGFHTKRNKSPSPAAEDKKKKKDKKKSKKKRDSSSSSGSDSSSSESDAAKKKSKAKKLKGVDLSNNKKLEAWMANIQTDRLTSSDRQLLNTLKSRIKIAQSSDKRRSTSRDRERTSDSKRNKKSGRKSRSRESRSRESTDRRSDRDRDDRRQDRRTPQDTKKPEIKKMPFIGKMPVYKAMGKNSKLEEQKKDDQKKKEDDDVTKKKLEQDAEIQKKVAVFKEKLAKAQLEKAQAELPPPPLALPAALGQPFTPVISAAQLQPAAVAVPGQPPLPKDFQDALDIIFPTDAKATEKFQQDIFNAINQPSLLGVPPPLMAGFPHLGLMQPPPQMFGFDLNTRLFPQAQLYDTHVPLLTQQPQQKQHRQNNNKKKNIINNNKNNNQNKQNNQANNQRKENGEEAKKKEEMDDLAMLGIDASDVGSGYNV